MEGRAQVDLIWDICRAPFCEPRRNVNRQTCYVRVVPSNDCG